MEFDILSNLVWNALGKYVKSQCILAGSKPQKSFFLSFHFGYITDKKYLKLFCFLKALIRTFWVFNFDF